MSEPFCLDDLGIDPTTHSAAAIAEHLDRRVELTWAHIQQTTIWRHCFSPQTPLPLVVDILKEVYLEIVMYQPDSLRAALNAIGQMPRSMPVPWIEEMLHHQAEEFDHSEMALRDYVGFGGSEQFARQRKQSPSAFAIAAVWNYLANKQDPFLYLGAVYLFDALTPIVSAYAKDELRKRGVSPQGLEFVDHHATADIEHARQLNQLIRDVSDRYPESKTSICYGFEYFLQVYPLPAWTSAYSRACSRHNHMIAAE